MKINKQKHNKIYWFSIKLSFNKNLKEIIY